MPTIVLPVAATGRKLRLQQLAHTLRPESLWTAPTSGAALRLGMGRGCNWARCCPSRPVVARFGADLASSRL